MNTIQNLARVYKPAPGTTQARREIDWTKLSNDDLRFALNTLSLHQSPFEVDVANEITRRIANGLWVDILNPPPPLHNIPIWLSKWLPRSLWRQRP
jgi:hypothetical protein